MGIRTRLMNLQQPEDKAVGEAKAYRRVSVWGNPDDVGRGKSCVALTSQQVRRLH